MEGGGERGKGQISMPSGPKKDTARELAKFFVSNLAALLKKGLVGLFFSLSPGEEEKPDWILFYLGEKGKEGEVLYIQGE